MAREIDRKLQLTAALLGAETRKDLAAAFRRVNAATPFHVDRSHKWLQGRAAPRGMQLYEDWAKLLDLGRPGQWIADCESEAFLEAICVRHQRDPAALRRRADKAAGVTSQQSEKGPGLAGTYACYSHAWSPYFRGRVIRGELAIAVAPRQLSVSYAETLPTGRIQLDGEVTIGKRAMNLDVRDGNGEAQFLFCLFPPTPPVSVLAGFMCGATVIGPEVQPSVTRIVIVRLPAASIRLRNTDAYLAPRASIAADLAALGVPVTDPAAADHLLDEFLTAGPGGGLDQIAAGTYSALVEVFDRARLALLASAG